jgi:glycosyltransferase involved in cell wall biosynthesis
MKVVFYTENYVVGGCDRFLVDLVRNLDPGVFATCLAGNVNPGFDRWLAHQLPSHLPREVVHVSTLPGSRLARHAAATLGGEPTKNGERRGSVPRGVSSVGAAALRYQQAVTNYVRLRRFFRRLGPNVLHINNGGYPGGETCRVAALAARAEGVRTIVHFVHNMAYPPAFPAAGERMLDRKIDQATDLWLTAADRATMALHEHRHVPRERIVTVHYGIDRASATRGGGARNGGRPVVAVVASFEPRKGHRYLLEALAALKRAGFPTSALFVGEGPERPMIQQRATEAGLAEDVRFLGWREDVDELLSASDLLVLPSVANECLPYAILEAMSHGLPVVSTDVAGIPDLVADGVTGRVVPPADAGELARAIREIAGDPVRSRAMGKKAEHRVTTEFSLERMVARMSDIYRQLAAEPG